MASCFSPQLRQLPTSCSCFGRDTRRSLPGPTITLLKDSSIFCLPRHQDFAELVTPVAASGSDQPVVAAFGRQAGQITALLWTHPTTIPDPTGHVFRHVLSGERFVDRGP